MSSPITFRMLLRRILQLIWLNFSVLNIFGPPRPAGLQAFAKPGMLRILLFYKAAYERQAPGGFATWLCHAVHALHAAMYQHCRHVSVFSIYHTLLRSSGFASQRNDSLRSYDYATELCHMLQLCRYDSVVFFLSGLNRRRLCLSALHGGGELGNKVTSQYDIQLNLTPLKYYPPNCSYSL